MENLFFFTGENTYALTRELLRWKQSFREKYGDENLLSIQGKTATLSELLDAVETMPFIAEKRLVILEGIPKIEREQFERFQSSIHPQTIVAIVDSKPDKRLGVVKDVERTAQTKRFPILKPAELIEWMKAQAKAEESSIDFPAAKALLDIVGEDQWTLEAELKKLALFAQGEIKETHVEALAVPSGSQVLWRLTDLIGNRQTNEALAFLRHRLDRGEDPYGIWTILLNMVKNLALVAAAQEAGHRDERSIATEVGLHFLAVRGVLSLARALPRERIRTLVDWVADADIQLKSGGYHYSAEHPEEVIALAERMVLSCA